MPVSPGAVKGGAARRPHGSHDSPNTWAPVQPVHVHIVGPSPDSILEVIVQHVGHLLFEQQPVVASGSPPSSQMPACARPAEARATATARSRAVERKERAGRARVGDCRGLGVWPSFSFRRGGGGGTRRRLT